MSGEYVQVKKIDKAALKITADPSNQGWSKDTQRFGYKMLMKWGWTEGKGLGSSEQGSTEHVKVTKKDDKLGVGVGERRGTETWLASSSSFNSILARLNEAYGKQAAVEPKAEVKAEPEEIETPVAESKKSSKKRRKAATAAADEPAAAEEADAEAPNAEEKEESKVEEKKEANGSEQRRVRHKYHKMLHAKTVSNYSETDLNAILGTMKRKEKQDEAARVEAIEAEQDSLVPTVAANTSMSVYFDGKLKKEKKHR